MQPIRFAVCDYLLRTTTAFKQGLGFRLNCRLPLLNLQKAVERLMTLGNPHETRLFAFDAVQLLGESATHPTALRLLGH